MPLGLGHWTIDQVSIADETPGGPNAEACVQPSYAYDTCTFWFTHSFVESASLRALDEAIIHEWVHVFMRDFDQTISSVDDELSPATERIWSDRIHHEREGVVDRIARALYVFYMAPKKADIDTVERIARSTS